MDIAHDPLPKLAELKSRLSEIDDVNRAGAILSWDQTTYMPPGGGPARARQAATLGRLAHEKFVGSEIGRLLDVLEPYERSLPFDDDGASLIRVTRRNYLKSVKVPPAFLGEFYAHVSESYMTWTQARPANDFKAVVPALEKTLDYSRKMAGFFAPYEHIADPLIDFADDGMRASTVSTVFGRLRERLVPIARQILEQAPADDSCLRQPYSEDLQLAFGRKVVEAMGYDFKRGRQDKTHHPFCTTFSVGDVRITTRVKTDDLSEALFSTMHEAGHAMYEQGVNPEYEASPLQGGTSAGVHESQSRTWENLVGRSREFWSHYYPTLQAAFPAQLGSVSQDVFYRAINKVERSLIRTDADEVTYNLHVMIRFDLELQMLQGTLAIADLPAAWHARYQSDLGISAPDNKDGCLQDVHWYAGLIGGSFQGYTLGNILSAQIFGAAERAHPGIRAEIGQGEFGTLHQWLRDNIYAHGSKYTANELIHRVTGGPLDVEPYVAYLRAKYGELYALA